MAVDNGGQDNSMDFVWGIFAFLAVAIALWVFGHGTIIKGYFYLWRAEIWVLSHFTNSFDLLVPWLQAHWNDTEHITLHQFLDLASKMGQYSRWVTIAVLLPLAYFMMFNMPEERFKRKFDMQWLAKVQGEKFPFIKPPLKHDLVSQDPTKGPWASAQTELEFSRKHGLLNAGNELDRKKTEEVFARQLGRPFESLKALRQHELALFALFAVRACFDFDDDKQGASTQLINQLSNSYTDTGKIDITGVNDLIIRCSKHAEWKNIQRVMKRHAFVSTMLCSMLQLGRQSGVLAPVTFLWLKPVDRGLWYALHQLEPPSPSTLPGQLVRKRVWAEASGVRAHWIAEVLSKRALMMPVVQEAVNGLELAIDEFEIANEEK